MTHDRAKDDEQDERRFVEAIAFGMFADEIFEDACRLCGVTPRYDFSPLLTLEVAGATDDTIN